MDYGLVLVDRYKGDKQHGRVSWATFLRTLSTLWLFYKVSLKGKRHTKKEKNAVDVLKCWLLKFNCSKCEFRWEGNIENFHEVLTHEEYHKPKEGTTWLEIAINVMHPKYQFS